MPGSRLGTGWRALLVRLSVAAQALRTDWATAVLLALRALPRSVARLVRRTPGSGPALRLLAAWRLGDAASVGALLSTPPAEQRAALRVAAAAVALDRTDAAARLLDGLPAGPARARVEALAALRDGRLSEAQALLDGAPGPAAARLRARIERERRALEPGWTPSLPSGRLASPSSGDRADVLHVVTNSLPLTAAGYTLRTQLIARAQRAAGLDPHVATRVGYPAAQGRRVDGLDPVVDGVPHHRLLPAHGLPADPQRRMQVHAELLDRLVDRIAPRVLHAATDHLNGRAALAVGRARGIPVVYEVRGFLEQSWLSRRTRDPEAARASERYRLSRESETGVMRAAAAVVTLSEPMRAEIVGRGIPPERVHVVPNAVDERLLGAAPDAAALRADWGVGAEELVIGSIGTLYRHEGLADLVDAVALLRADGAPVRLVVVGDGPERAALEQRARDTGLGAAAVFTGRVAFADIHRHYAAIDVFAVPRADHEVTRLVSPLKPVEAMATGRAVVVSDLPALRELVAEGETGLVSPPGDPAALADAIRPLLYDPAARSALGRAAQASVARDRTWARNAERYQQLYRSIGAVED